MEAKQNKSNSQKKNEARKIEIVLNRKLTKQIHKKNVWRDQNGSFCLAQCNLMWMEKQREKGEAFDLIDKSRILWGGKKSKAY